MGCNKIYTDHLDPEPGHFGPISGPLRAKLGRLPRLDKEKTYRDIIQKLAESSWVAQMVNALGSHCYSLKEPGGRLRVLLSL